MSDDIRKIAKAMGQEADDRIAALQARIAELEAEVQRLRGLVPNIRHINGGYYRIDLDRISDILDGKPDGPLIFGRAWK